MKNPGGYGSTQVPDQPQQQTQAVGGLEGKVSALDQISELKSDINELKGDIRDDIDGLHGEVHVVRKGLESVTSLVKITMKGMRWPTPATTSSVELTHKEEEIKWLKKESDNLHVQNLGHQTTIQVLTRTTKEKYRRIQYLEEDIDAIDPDPEIEVGNEGPQNMKECPIGGVRTRPRTFLGE
ncbi:hypothetical protein SELMODRAFT_429167 [Selaginella moellendorffii]|uniref:Uncharacterized protein n=1 Tax=Selaginella moellendorffii TaxID=88036 RepID=D8T595_SELML|nr:hypothetical protein SELMODRAFT_429167 [Selaginella moellendorffii]